MKEGSKILLRRVARVLALAAGLLLALSCQNPMSGVGTSPGVWSNLSSEEQGSALTARWYSPPVYTWQTETVDGTGIAGLFLASFEDPGSGKPHISYFDALKQSVEYASREESGWSVATVDQGLFTGLFTSLVLDGSGRPCISYWKYEPSAGPNTGFLVLLDPVTGAPVVLDPSSKEPVPAVGLGVMGIAGAELRVARWDGAAWRIETIDSGSLGAFTSMTADPAGNPCVAYWKCVNRADPACGRPLGLPKWELRFARWTGSRWVIQRVDKASLGLFPSVGMVQVRNGYPCISYWKCAIGIHQYVRAFLFGKPMKPTSWELKLARWKGTSWAIEKLDTSRLGLFTSLAMDEYGHPSVAYWKCDAESLGKLGAAVRARLAGGPPYVPEEPEGEPGADVEAAGLELQALVLEPQEDSLLTLTGSLNYIRCIRRDYAVQTIDSGCLAMFPSMVMGVRSVPSVSYFDSTSRTFKYAQRDDRSGWRIQPIDGAISPGGFSSLSLGPGRLPRIGYVDPVVGGVRYARAALTSK